jgi:SAM-dependent methyltransferase
MEKTPKQRGDRPSYELKNTGHGEKLTTEKFWDAAWSIVNLPRYFDKNDRDLSGYHKHFLRYFPPSERLGDKKLLEVGCGASRWLPYFRREFGFEVWGLDSSEVGAWTAKENLRLLDVEGKIVLGDLFGDNEIPVDYFDFVVSLGLVEHFTRPADVLGRIASFAKKGSLVFTQIPNVCGIHGMLSKLVNREAYASHYPISVDEFLAAHHEVGLQSVDTPGPFGVINIRQVPYPITGYPRLAKIFVSTFVDLIDRAAYFTLRHFSNKSVRSWFAPDIIGTFRKSD